MTTLQTAAGIFALAYAAIATAAALRGPGSRPLRTALLVLRLTLLALLLAAALRPALTLNRLAPPPGPPVILLDNSRSMVLFHGPDLWDSTLAPVVDSLGVPVLLFGDSLRTHSGSARPSSGDTRSFLPYEAPPVLARAQRVVLVSDGAWSNARLPRGLLADRDVRFLQLEQTSRQPWLVAEALEERIESRQGDTATLHVAVTARGEGERRATVRCTRGGTEVARRTIRLQPGLSRDTVSLRLVGRAAGAALCRISCTVDSLQSTAHAVHVVVPELLRAAFYTATPRLDSRFLGRTLRNSGKWDIVDPGDPATRPHLLVACDWDSSASTLLRRLAPGGIVLFAGNMPCGGETLTRMSDCVILPADAAARTAFPLASLSVPAPLRLRLCAAQQGRLHTHMLLRARLEDGTTDSLPLVVSGAWERRGFVGITAAGFWRWDFAAVNEALAGQSPFCTAVLALARERLVANLTNGLVVFPAESPLSEHRDIRLLALFPPEDDWENRSRLRCVVTDTGGDTLRDTTLVVEGGESRAELNLGGLPRGGYLCAARITRRGTALVFSDSLQVEPDRAEMLVDGQNTHLLSQLGRPVSPEAGLLAELLRPSSDRDARQTVPVTVRIEPTWQLLALLLLLFAAEWFIRRAAQLDR